jgi:hypothetical protein
MFEVVVMWPLMPLYLDDVDMMWLEWWDASKFPISGVGLNIRNNPYNCSNCNGLYKKGSLCCFITCIIDFFVVSTQAFAEFHE